MQRQKPRLIHASIFKQHEPFVLAGIVLAAASIFLISKSYAVQKPITLTVGSFSQTELVREHGINPLLEVRPGYWYCFIAETHDFLTPSSPFLEVDADGLKKRCFSTKVDEPQIVDVQLGGVTEVEVVRKKTTPTK